MNQQEVHILTTPGSDRSVPQEGECSKYCIYISYSRGDLAFRFSKSEEWELNILDYKQTWDGKILKLNLPIFQVIKIFYLHCLNA